MDDNAWARVIESIKRDLCTPFIGAGANHPLLPLGGQLAKDLAAEWGYPFDDTWNLPRVTQFQEVTTGSPTNTKAHVVDVLQAAWQEKLDNKAVDTDHPLARLCCLPISCFVTTNYDPCIDHFLRVAPTPKKPSRSRCSWNGRKAEPIPEFSVTEPLVFHLHGYWDDFRSLVLTESDYVDFLVSLTRDADKRARNQAETLPPQIRERLSDTGLLFLGYGLEDWNFRVIHRALVLDQALSGQERSIAVQLDPGGAGADFVRQYLDKLGVDVYFGTANEFIEELMSRWS